MLPCLPANSECFDNRAITLDILLDQIVKQAATLTDHLQQTATGVMVLLVRFKMLGQVRDPFRQKCNLYFRGPGITFMPLKSFNYFLFALCSKQLHSPFLFSKPVMPAVNITLHKLSNAI